MLQYIPKNVNIQNYHDLLFRTTQSRDYNSVLTLFDGAVLINLKLSGTLAASLVKLFSRHSNVSKIMQVITLFQSHKGTKWRNAYVAVFDELMKHNELSKAEKVYESIKTDVHEFDAATNTSVIKLLFKLGRVEEVKKILDQEKSPDMIMYNTILNKQENV